MEIEIRIALWTNLLVNVSDGLFPIHSPEAAIEETEASEFLRWMDATQPMIAVDELEQSLKKPLVYGNINIIT